MRYMDSSRRVKQRVMMTWHNPPSPFSEKIGTESPKEAFRNIILFVSQQEAASHDFFVPWFDEPQGDTGCVCMAFKIKVIPSS